MTEHWDEKILDVWNELQMKRQLEEMSRQRPQLTWEECLAAAELGSMEYDGRTFAFEEKVLFDGHVSMILPRTLQLMPRGLVGKSSTAQQHEQLAFQDEAGTMLLGLNHMIHALSVNESEIFLREMTAQIKSKTPGLQIVKNDVWEQAGRLMASYEYVVPKPDGNFYQIMFATSLNGRAFFGSLVFSASEAWVWQPLATALIRTLKISEGV